MPPSNKVVTHLRNSVDQSESLWFSLLPEIRNRIYEIAFREDQAMYTTSGGFGQLAPHGVSKHPAILLTCKHVYAEALQIYFSETRFIFDTKSALMHWVINIGPQNCRQVSRVDLRLSSSNQYRYLKRWETECLATAMQREIQDLREKLAKKQMVLRAGMLRIRCTKKYRPERILY